MSSSDLPDRPPDRPDRYFALLRFLAHEPHASDILAVAVALSPAPRTVAELCDVLQRKRPWVDRALRVGAGMQVFTKHVLAHNKYRWTLAAAWAAGGAPPDTPDHEHAPSDASAFTIGRRIRSHGGGHRAQQTPCARPRHTARSAVPTRPSTWVPSRPAGAVQVGVVAACLPGEPPAPVAFQEPEKLAAVVSTKPGKLAPHPLGTKGQDPEAPQYLRTRGRTPSGIAAPDAGTAARVIALADTWAAACRSAFGAAVWRSAFTTRTPWASDDAAQRRRWTAYLRLDQRLREWGADPGEFCVAITQHFAQWHTAGKRRVPNPTQVSGEWGWRIWWQWHMARRGELGLPTAPTQRAQLELSSRREQIIREIRHAWQTCRYRGVLPGLELTWRPEVLWLLQLTDLAARRVLTDMLHGAHDPVADTVRSGLAKINANSKFQRWLMACRTDALGMRWTPLPMMPVQGAPRAQEVGA